MHEMKPIQIAINDVNGIVNKVNDVTSGRGRYKASKVVIRRKPCGILKIGTWNVRTMMKKEKNANVKREMERNRLNIFGLGEFDGKNKVIIEVGSIEWYI